MNARRLLTVLLLFVLAVFLTGAVSAQEATEEPPPAEVLPTDPPVDIDPTEPPPTEIPPTEIPPIEDPTAEPPAPPEPEPTEPPDVEPIVTPVGQPPVFLFDASVVLQAQAGLPLVVQFSVADEAGVVRVMADTASTAGTVVLTQTDPEQTEPPFYTPVTLTYTAPADFAGPDGFGLIALDGSGLTAALTVQVLVSGPEATEEPPTPDPTQIPSEVLVINYDPATSEADIAALLATLGAVEISRIPQIGAMKVLVPASISEPAAAMSLLRRDIAALADSVINIEPVFEYSIDLNPNDPQYPNRSGRAHV